VADEGHLTDVPVPVPPPPSFHGREGIKLLGDDREEE